MFRLMVDTWKRIEFIAFFESQFAEEE